MQEEHYETQNFTHIHPEGLLLDQEVEEERRYRLSLWWVQNKGAIKRIGLVVFLVVDLLLLAIAGWYFVDAYLLQRTAEETALEQMVASGQLDLNAYTQATAAKDLDFEKPKVFALGGGEYDFYATLINTNKDWWAEFTYQFSFKNGETELQAGFILPDEEKPLVALGIESEGVLTSASLVIASVEWHRVDHHMTGEYETWFADRYQFTISDAIYTQTVELEEDGDLDVGRVTFTVKNESPFSYYSPRFYVVLLRNTTPVGVNTTTLQSIETGSEHDVTLNWFGSRPGATSVEIIPEINLFDIDVYKPLKGELADDLRTRVFDR
jgi:hypothetical protein